MESIAARLLDWYDKVKRDLPWRHDPTPYRVWVSEIMLQQTRVEAVRVYYERWMAALPTVWDLAACPSDRLHKLWEGLGYYTRVQNLKKAAQIVCEQYNGQLPKDVSLLRALPGIGDYTAGAIASIAFGLPTPAVDGNVLRVLSRFVGDDTDILTPQARHKAYQTLAALIPSGRSGDFTQAMFEWGAMLCTPTSPKCEQCPFASDCVAYLGQMVDRLPVRINKTKRTQKEITVLVLCQNDRYALTPPKEKGLLAGVYGLPYVEENLDEEGCLQWADAHGYKVSAICRLPPARHVFSHVTWSMIGYRLSLEGQMDDYVWATAEEIAQGYALPTAFGAYKRYLK